MERSQLTKYPLALFFLRKNIYICYRRMTTLRKSAADNKKKTRKIYISKTQIEMALNKKDYEKITLVGGFYDTTRYCLAVY